MSEFYCGDCRQPCKEGLVDFGIGPYEFWGRKGNDVQKSWVSSCCEGTLFEDSDCMIESDDPEPPEPDYNPSDERNYA